MSETIQSQHIEEVETKKQVLPLPDVDPKEAIATTYSPEKDIETNKIINIRDKIIQISALNPNLIIHYDKNDGMAYDYHGKIDKYELDLINDDSLGVTFVPENIKLKWMDGDKINFLSFERSKSGTYIITSDIWSYNKQEGFDALHRDEFVQKTHIVTPYQDNKLPDTIIYYKKLDINGISQEIDNLTNILDTIIQQDKTQKN